MGDMSEKRQAHMAEQLLPGRRIPFEKRHQGRSDVSNGRIVYAATDDEIVDMASIGLAGHVSQMGARHVKGQCFEIAANGDCRAFMQAHQADRAARIELYRAGWPIGRDVLVSDIDKVEYDEKRVIRRKDNSGLSCLVVTGEMGDAEPGPGERLGRLIGGVMDSEMFRDFFPRGSLFAHNDLTSIHINLCCTIASYRRGENASALNKCFELSDMAGSIISATIGGIKIVSDDDRSDAKS